MAEFADIVVRMSLTSGGGSSPPDSWFLCASEVIELWPRLTVNQGNSVTRDNSVIMRIPVVDSRPLRAFLFSFFHNLQFMFLSCFTYVSLVRKRLRRRFAWYSGTKGKRDTKGTRGSQELPLGLLSGKILPLMSPGGSLEVSPLNSLPVHLFHWSADPQGSIWNLHEPLTEIPYS